MRAVPGAHEAASPIAGPGRLHEVRNAAGVLLGWITCSPEEWRRREAAELRRAGWVPVEEDVDGDPGAGRTGEQEAA